MTHDDNDLWPDAADPLPALEWKILVDLRYLVVLHLVAAIGWLMVALG